MVGNALVAEPGLSVVMPGSGVIRIIPVSVCHHVSTTGVRLPPMCSRYHTHASGLIGSPTEPSTRSELRSCFCAYSGPHFICVRMVVGADGLHLGREGISIAAARAQLGKDGLL